MEMRLHNRSFLSISLGLVFAIKQLKRVLNGYESFVEARMAWWQLKRMCRCAVMVKCAKKNNFEIILSHLFLRAKTFLVSHIAAHVGRRSEDEEKVGRVVSLSIDLQGISELDRDAVIASRAWWERRKDFVYVQRCITFSVFSFLPARTSRNFLIRCKCTQRQRRSRKKLVLSLLLLHCHLFSLHIFIRGFINRIQEISLNGRVRRRRAKGDSSRCSLLRFY